MLRNRGSIASDGIGSPATVRRFEYKIDLPRGVDVPFVLAR